MASSTSDGRAAGKVFFIGGGPGDPGLLTVRGHQILKSCDAILYDDVLNQDLLALAPERAVPLYVGATPEVPAKPAQKVAGQLVSLARRGLRVVRLVQGDPYFASGAGEEILACRAQGVEYEVVPGVSSIASAPAYAGIPLVQPGLSSSVLVLCGPYSSPPQASGIVNTAAVATPIPIQLERKPGVVIRRRKKMPVDDALAEDTGSIVDRVQIKPQQLPPTDPIPIPGALPPQANPKDTDWPAVCRAAETLVFLKAKHHLREIHDGLVAGGRPPNEPVAAVSRGATPYQQTCITSIDRMLGDIEARQMRSPLMLVVGDVVNLREHLNIFEQKPLFGLRVALTRPAARIAETRRLFEDAGATIRHFPVIQTAPVAGLASVVGELRDDLRLSTHLIFANESTVEFFFKALNDAGLDTRLIPERCQIMAVGTAAADLLKSRNLAAAVVKEPFSDKNLLESFPVRMAGDRVLILGTTESHGTLVRELRIRGANVTEVPIYDSTPSAVAVLELRQALQNGELDVVVFHSANAVNAVAEAVGRESMISIFARVLVGSVGTDALGALAQCRMGAILEGRDGNNESFIRALESWRIEESAAGNKRGA